MFYTKIRNVKNPTGNRTEDAGIDFYIPDSFTPTYLHLNEQILIPLGIKVLVPYGYELRLDNKSGISLKKGLLVGGGIVDHGYHGEVMVNLMKVVKSSEDNEDGSILLKPGDKIVQGVLVAISTENIQELSEGEYNKLTDVLSSSRGEKGYGSTGDK